MSAQFATARQQCSNVASGDFKQHLYSQLKAAGVMSSLKSQLRSEVLTKLQKQECSIHATLPSSEALWRNVMNSLFVDYLSACHYHYTLSVFQPEAGISGLQALTHADILQMMQVGPGTPLQVALDKKMIMRAEEGTNSEPAFVISLLQSVTDVLGLRSVTEVAIQTAEYDDSPLSLALQKLEDTYLKQSQEERERPYRSMEQRMAAYRQECEARLQDEVCRQVGQVREVEVRAARGEGVHEARQLADRERARLQQDHQERLQQLQAQEQQMVERVEKQQRDMESNAQEQRQQLQVQEEDLATWKADAQRQLDMQQGRLNGREQRVASREQTMARQDAESAGQVAEAQAAAASAYRNARQDLDQEYKAQREVLDRERRALEADRERVQRLEGEVVSLRGSNKRLKAAEASWAEAEARAAAHAGVEEALRYQLSHLQNAVKGRGGGLGEAGIAAVYPPGRRPPGQGLDPAFLAVQLRKLQKKQKGMLHELQATAAREAFWQSSSQCAEKALDEAVEGREAALQQVEEARMALRAAERDNGELQARLHHMPTSSRSHHRHQGEPTARQLWAVPRERGAAYGSTAVSPVSRVGDIGKQEKRMQAELANFKRQVQSQRDAAALELRRLQRPSPSPGGSTPASASGLSASTASSLSGYSTDLEEGAALTGPSPLPFVSPSHGLGPQMQPKLAHTSYPSSPLYTAHTYSPPLHQAAPHMPGHQPGSHALQHSHGTYRMQLPQTEQQLPGVDSGPQGSRQVAATGRVSPGEQAPKQRDAVAAQLNPAADPLPALHTNLAAMQEAIDDTAAAVLPSGQAPISEAGDLVASERPAGVVPQHDAAPRSTPAVVLKQSHPGTSKPDEHELAVRAPGSSAPPTAALAQQTLSTPSSTTAQAISHQAASMPSATLGPPLPQPSTSMPVGRLAPVGPPAVRSMVSQGPGALPQLAAPAVLPLPLPAKPAIVHSATAAAASPSAADVELTTDKVNGAATAGTNTSSKVPSSTANISADAGQGSSVTGQTAGHAGDEGVLVSAASAVMLDEARAAGTARQAALAVLDDTPQPTWSASHTSTNGSLPDHPFGAAQSGVTTAANQLTQHDALPSLQVSDAGSDKPLGLMSMASRIGRPAQSLMTMTGPSQASGAGQDPESPLGGRPSQSETALTGSKGVATVTEPQDLHAAHLVHVLHAHRASQQVHNSAAESTKQLLNSQLVGSSLASDSSAQAADSSHAGDHPGGQQQKTGYAGAPLLGEQHSLTQASEDAESINSQLQPVRSGELQVKASVPDLDEQEGGSMMALPKEPSTASVASGSGDDDGFPGVDYNDVYKMKNTYAEDDMSEDLPEAEIASIGSISIADAEVEMADCDAASEDSVF